MSCARRKTTWDQFFCTSISQTPLSLKTESSKQQWILNFVFVSVFRLLLLLILFSSYLQLFDLKKTFFLLLLLLPLLFSPSSHMISVVARALCASCHLHRRAQNEWVKCTSKMLRTAERAPFNVTIHTGPYGIPEANPINVCMRVWVFVVCVCLSCIYGFAQSSRRKK